MTVQTIENLGGVGIITDTPPHALPPNAWSAGNNVRFKETGVHKISGYLEVMPECPVKPLYLYAYTDIQGNKFFLAFGPDAIAVYSKVDAAWYLVTGQTSLKLAAQANAGATQITVDTGAELSALAPATNGKLRIGNEDTNSSNPLEWITYTGYNDSTGVLTLAEPLVYTHAIDSEVTPIETTTTTDVVYNADATTNKWVVTNLNGIVVATNGVDEPIKWHLTQATSVPWTGSTSSPNRFTTLTNWPEDDHLCKSIRAYKTFLVGLNWRRNSVNEPRLVKWSTGSAAANEPVTWNELDSTLDAGEYPLTDTNGDIVDGLQLGEQFMIYKNDSVYAMNFVGTPYIFAFKLITTDAGLLSKNAVCAFEGGHFFVGNSDMYVCNGSTVQAILPGMVRDEVFKNISGTFHKQTYVVADYVRNEIMACYPSGKASLPNRALIWNYKANTFSFRDIPDCTSMAAGKFDISEGLDWEEATTLATTWDAETSRVWTENAYDANKLNLLMSDALNDKIYRDTIGEKEDGELMSVFVERSGMDFGDPSTVKYVSAVYPKMQSSGEGKLKVRVGGHMSPDEAVAWEGPYEIDPDVRSKISCRVSGKYIAVRLESDSNMTWSVEGLGMDVNIRGSRGSIMR